MPRCKHCRILFDQYEFNNKYCLDIECQTKKALYKLSQIKTKDKKDWKKRKTKIKESLKTRSDYLKEVQVVFNRWIRLSKKQECISCGTDLRGRKFDAGHYRSVGNNPSLRFDLNNVWPQCVYCNQHLSGNPIEYRIRLSKLITPEQLEYLETEQPPKHYSIPELIELKEKYKEKIRILNNNN